MKPEPLKKECTCGLRRHRHDEDIKSAMKLLKEKDSRVYEQINILLDEYKVNNDLIIKINSNLMKLKLNKDKAFPDLK